MNHNTIRILLADDQVLFIQSLKRVIESLDQDIEVVGIAYDGEEAIRMARELQPDITILDVRMPKIDGVHAVEHIRNLHPQSKIIMLTTFDNDDYVHEALAKGACGYLLKDIEPQKLVNAIRAVAAGTVLMSETIANKIIAQMVSQTQTSDKIQAKPRLMKSYPDWYHELSYREREVAVLLAKGLDNHEISNTMFLAEQTVKNHISSLYKKLNVKDRTLLIQKLKPLLEQ
ncbi:response regulator transcription factor [Gracilinema caldarium]|uniref:response regulator transcription factor n=1 Tax=Gracilinema caldarium TaxID=215591 RepID=UPI0026EE6D2C|nr:response regulator transcription factor [Gracilinema caldarium]